ncbi:MAG: hypothetical protein J5636_10505 [Clostridiales bacterium]|nr:hypothetical protein [Clostridiales bacterium]
MDSVKVCMLLDFYGQLLTERTRDILELRFQEDMSLAEIAEDLSISRQAAHDAIHRGVSSLTEYEEKLKLVERFAQQKKTINSAFTALEEHNEERAKELLATLIEEL